MTWNEFEQDPKAAFQAASSSPLLLYDDFVPTEVLMSFRHYVKLLRQNADTGSLDPGKWADIIAVQGDPLADIRILQHVLFVMKGGIIYKHEAKPTAVDKLQTATATVNVPITTNAF